MIKTLTKSFKEDLVDTLSRPKKNLQNLVPTQSLKSKI